MGNIESLKISENYNLVQNQSWLMHVLKYFVRLVFYVCILSKTSQVCLAYQISKYATEKGALWDLQVILIFLTILGCIHFALIFLKLI